MKTYKEWVESKLDLYDFLGEYPVEIDEDIFYDQLGAVSPAYYDFGLLQVGEPYTHLKSDNTEYGIPAYCTIKIVTDKDYIYRYFYIGILPEFNK